MMKRVAYSLSAFLLLAVFSMDAVAERSPILQELEDSFVRLHEDVRPSVVNVETETRSEQEMGVSMEDLFRFFGVPVPEGGPERQPRPRQGTGSGFIYDAENGYIITNNHVVADAEMITVRLWNGNEYEAEIVGTDPDTDLAVIQIDANEPLVEASLGDSDALRVGQFAIAMGSPRGFEGSLSFGHISALGRDNLVGLAVQGLRFQNLIQTDAAINLGNSGGPLTNIEGEVVGINVAIMYGANSIGFAIPINTAKMVVPQLIDTGEVVRGFLGVNIDDVAEYQSAIGLDDSRGAFVVEVRPETPAERAGLKPYDVIRKVDDHEIDSARDLMVTIASYPPDTEVTLEVWRDEATEEILVTLDKWEADGPGSPTARADREILGMNVRNLEPEMLQRMNLPEDTEGVLVTGVTARGPAERANIFQGDIITEIARQPVTSVSQFRELVNEHATPGSSILVRYVRGGGATGITVIQVPEED